MTPRSFVRAFALVCVVRSLTPSPNIAAQVARDTSANARLRALYTAEWTWRQREMARRSDDPGEAGASDHFPRVDAASQQARLAYWTRALASLDSIPLARLSPDVRVNADVFRSWFLALANDVMF
jgi:uncharacterized protein (DUF885 family)